MADARIKEKQAILEEYKSYLNKVWRKEDDYLYTYRKGIKFSKKDEEDILNQFIFLLDRLGDIQEYDAVLLSIGACGPNPQQQLPNFIRHFKKPNKVLVLNVDIDFFQKPWRDIAEKNSSLIRQEKKDHYGYSSSVNDEDISLEMFACYLPDMFCPLFSQYLERQIIQAMNRNRQVFIANHTQAYSLKDIPAIAEVYNKVKKIHPEPDLLQLYTQGGRSNQVTYYANLCYNKYSDYEYRSENTEKLLNDDESPAFYLHDDIGTLSQLSPFQPIQTKEVKKEILIENKKELKDICPEKQKILDKISIQIASLSKNNDPDSTKKIKALNIIHRKLLSFNTFHDYKSYQTLRTELSDIAKDEQNEYSINQFNRGMGYIGATIWQRTTNPITGTKRVIFEAIEFLETQFNKAHAYEESTRKTVDQLTPGAHRSRLKP